MNSMEIPSIKNAKRPGKGKIPISAGDSTDGTHINRPRVGPGIFESSIVVKKQTYKYSPIRADEIRLIQFQRASKPSDTICCELKVRKLGDPDLHYETLSYTWGNEDATEEILMQTEAGRSTGWTKVHETVVHPGPRPFYVRRNLDEALRYLREDDDDELFWVDAICINQADETEKSVQVAKMADIYSRANGVFIWLGKELDNSPTGMDFVEDILKLEQQDTFSVKGLSPQQWIAFMSLMGRDWFQRRWVVQELALSENAYLTCGDKSVNWSKFGSAVRFFISRLETLTALYNDSAEFRQKLSSLGNLQASGAHQIIDTTDKVLRRSTRLRSLESLVSELAMFEVGDPRDAIYALVSLAKDAHNISRMEPKPPNAFATDYNKNILQVFKDFTAFCINTSGTLDIICRKWAPNQRRKKQSLFKLRGLKPPSEEVLLPSWIGLVRDSAYGLSHVGPKARSAADTLVGTPGSRQYNASGTRKAQVLFGEVMSSSLQPDERLDFRNKDLEANPSTTKSTPKRTLQTQRGFQSNGTLYAKGFFIDVIERVSHRLFEGLIPSEWLDLGGWIEKPGEHEEDVIPDQLWRTLVADRMPNGERAGDQYRELMGWAIGRRNINGDIHTAKLIRQGVPEAMITFLKRVQAIIWNKRFLLLSGKTEKTPMGNRFGLAPSHTQEGDIVCVLLGCSVPVVLRPVDISPESKCYELIGEAYVYDLIDEETLEPYSGYSDEEVGQESQEFCLI